MLRKLSSVLCLAAAIAAALTLAACGGGKSSTNLTTGTALVDTTVSDPATCQAPQGPYSHIYVTITDVKISTNANAGDNDPSFVDLTPALSSAPQQIDMLAAASNQCFLATLGAKTQLQPGTYQQIRVILLDNTQSAKVTNNKCGTSANCVQLSADNSIHTLQLSSESQTGIKIPSGQIAGGQFTVAAGQTKDLNIDINACASIVIAGSGQYRLKPVLHAGEVSTTSTSINGKVVDKTTSAALVGGTAIVALEQKDSTGVDRVIMETTADAAGNFTFCPVPSGTYDVVVAAVNGANVAYAPTVVTGVQPGNAIGSIPMIATTGTSTAAASITGQVTAATASSGANADVQLSALLPVTIGGASVSVTVPFASQSAATATVTTASGSTCPTGTNCVAYTLQVPAANPNIGTFSASGTTYTQGTGPVNYNVDGLAFVTGSGGTADCTPSEQKTAAIAVTAGATANAPALPFTGCQ